MTETKPVRRFHRLAFKDGAYYMYDYLSSGFGDDQIDDPLLAEYLFELLKNTHTVQIAVVRTQHTQVEAVVYVPTQPRGSTYVEIDAAGSPIPASFAREQIPAATVDRTWPEAFVDALGPLYRVIEQGLTSPTWQSHSYRTLGFGTLDRISKLLVELSDLVEERGNTEKARAALRLADQSLALVETMKAERLGRASKIVSRVRRALILEKLRDLSSLRQILQETFALDPETVSVQEFAASPESAKDHTFSLYWALADLYRLRAKDALLLNSSTINGDLIIADRYFEAASKQIAQGSSGLRLIWRRWIEVLLACGNHLLERRNLDGARQCADKGLRLCKEVYQSQFF